MKIGRLSSRDSFVSDAGDLKLECLCQRIIVIEAALNDEFAYRFFQISAVFLDSIQPQSQRLLPPFLQCYLAIHV